MPTVVSPTPIKRPSGNKSMIGKISLCLVLGSQVLVGMVGPAVLWRLAKLSLSQCQREQIPKGNLTGAGPGIVKPIKAEIAEWRDF